MSERLKSTAVRLTRAAAVAAVFALAHLARAAPPGDELGWARMLAQAGASELALERAAKLQPRDPGAAGWAEWESLRCAALGTLGRHAELAERLAARPRAALPAACHAAGAHALHALERHAEARAHAARALWLHALPAAQTQSLRRLVVATYVGERRADEAYRAILRYEQDHRPLPREVLAGFVDALLDLGRDQEALAWLAQLDDAQPAKLRLRLRAGLVPRDAALAQSRAALAKEGGAGYWKVVLDATRDAAASPVRIAAHERQLNAAELPASDAAPAARRLWDAYLAAAAAVANQAGLLVGDDAGWADHAGRRLGAEPEAARALFAHLAQHARSAATRHSAQLQLLHAYHGDRLDRVALRVFGAVFSDVDALDTQVRYRLGEMAQAGRQHGAAARYWRDLPAPAGMDAGEWMLRVARQRWHAAGEDTGVEASARHYGGRRQASAAAVEQAVRYAHELIERGQHAPARRLLEALADGAPVSRARILLDALALARERGGDPALAAEAYLRAALLAGDAPDAAAVQSRLKAGLALARAGYARDARAQLDWVLRNAKEPAPAQAARAALDQLQL